MHLFQQSKTMAVTAMAASPPTHAKAMVNVLLLEELVKEGVGDAGAMEEESVEEAVDAGPA